jgi:hypothetical protein
MQISIFQIANDKTNKDVVYGRANAAQRNEDASGYHA